ncbi:2OG-Fe(II) oxygenase [Undibacterium arcticum]|uniref:2OG-Fe(II) oxygenase n=1 Tax=Undibacterium arcticum TaxID=1762892 RepID=A0ABV7FB65_9BURK
MPPEWIRWIAENIERGVPPQTLIDTLVQHRFERGQATYEVESRLPGYLLQKRAAPAPAAAAAKSSAATQYQYEKMGPQPGNSITIDGHTIGLQMSLAQPHLMVFGNVLSKEECEQLIALSQSKLARSTTVDEQTGKAEWHADRTSSGTFFALNETPLIAKLDQRIAQLMQMPVVNGEGLQILNYQIGGEYKPHYDYFPPDQPGSAQHIAIGGQRVATLIIYLNEVEEGGATIFPELGLTVTPVQGSAVYFSYSNSKNQLDPRTYHGGNPVTKGEKWIATKWMRQREYRSA